jgi:MoaA/NifB/PqqE/SkfB family radical SAM enzyme
MSIPSKLTAWLTINRACNLRCGWCYAKGTAFSQHDTMSTKTAERSLDLLSDLGIKGVILIGGEPTIHPQFIDIVKKIRARNMATYVVTNALRFASSAFLTKATEAGIESITISLKASNAQDFLANTGTDGFAKTVRAIRNIVSANVPHVVNVRFRRPVLRSRRLKERERQKWWTCTQT